VPKTLIRLLVGVRRAFDVVAIIALILASYGARKGSLPFDGLWFDDSWVAAGAIHGRLTALLTDGSGTPGFTGLLMIVHRLGGGQLRDLGVPSLVAGVVAPSLLFVALRRVGYERSIALIVSAALVVARVHILYSGRVKGYTFDTVCVLLLVIVLPYLALRTWRWPLAVTWTVCAFLIGTFSAYTTAAVAGAAVVLVLHPRSDRIIRVGAVGVQAIAQLVYLDVAAHRVDVAGLEKVLQVRFDAHMNFSWNPISLAQESVTHLRRVAQVFPGGSGSWLTLFGLLAIAGLVTAATRGRSQSESIAARYLLLLVAFAVVGSFLHAFPFGPTNGTVTAGGRHTLWLIPAMALGLAAVAHRVRLLTARFDGPRLAFDAIVVASAVAIVFVGYKPAPAAPFPGSESATRYVDTSIRPGDVVIITSSSAFSFAASTATPVTLVPTPKHQVGFAPVFRDPRIHVIGPWAVRWGTAADIRSWVRDTDRVFVQAQGPVPDQGLQVVAGVLEPRGFRMERHDFGWAGVEVWRRVG
jgi:hypothetical protein